MHSRALLTLMRSLEMQVPKLLKMQQLLPLMPRLKPIQHQNQSKVYMTLLRKTMMLKSRLLLVLRLQPKLSPMSLLP